MKNSKEINNPQAAFEIMTNANISLSDKMFIIDTYRKQGAELSNDTVIFDGKYYANENVSGFLFTTEKEARFAEALLEFLSGHVSKDKAINNLFPIILRLAGIDSEWSLDLTK